jgi:hypothetical protein
MSLIDRMDDAQFNIRAALCAICQNEQKHKFDNGHPDQPLFSCKELGQVPEPIYKAISYKCKAFLLDEAKYKTHQNIIPKDVISENRPD